MTITFRSALVSLVAVLAISENARAEPQGLELVWSAPKECPTERDVIAAVELLVGERDAAQSRPLHADARVEKRGERYRLALGWSTATASAVRTVEGATCAEIAQAAAVIVALAADPATNLDELAAQSDEPPAPPPLAPAPPVPETKNPVPAAPRPDDPPPPPEEQSVERRPGLRAGAALDFGSLPRVAPGVFVGGELVVPPIGIIADALTFVPMDEVVPEGAGRFWLSQLSLRPCFRLPIADFVLAPCAALEAHVMLGEGERVDIPDERWAIYARLGVGAEAGYRISSELELVAGAFVLGAPSRPTFVIDTGTPVHEPAAVSGRLTLGFELRL